MFRLEQLSRRLHVAPLPPHSTALALTMTTIPTNRMRDFRKALSSWYCDKTLAFFPTGNVNSYFPGPALHAVSKEAPGCNLCISDEARAIDHALTIDLPAVEEALLVPAAQMPAGWFPRRPCATSR